MAQMRVAVGAADFGAHHEERAVLVLAHRVRAHRLVKARPAGAAVELRVRGKQRPVTAHAGVNALVLGVPVRPGKGALGAVLAGDVILLGRQLRAPLGIGFDDLRLPVGVLPVGGLLLGHRRLPDLLCRKGRCRPASGQGSAGKGARARERAHDARFARRLTRRCAPCQALSAPISLAFPPKARQTLLPHRRAMPKCRPAFLSARASRERLPEPVWGRPGEWK